MINAVFLARSWWDENFMQACVLELSRSMRGVTMSSVFAQRMTHEGWLREFLDKSSSLNSIRVYIPAYWNAEQTISLGQLLRCVGSLLQSLCIYYSPPINRKEIESPIYKTVESYCRGLVELRLSSIRIGRTMSAMLWCGIGPR